MDFFTNAIDKINLNDNKNDCDISGEPDVPNAPANNVDHELLAVTATANSSLQKPELKRCYNRDEAFDLGLPELPDGAEGNNTSWVQMEEQDIMNMFVELSNFKEDTEKIDWEKIDYEIYGEDWYRSKYPHFPDEWYALLVKASREKFKDLTKEKGEDAIKIEQGNFTVSFNK